MTGNTVTWTKMARNKRAMSTIITLIILLVVVVMLLAVVGALIPVLVSTSDIESCRLGFISASTFKVDNVLYSANIVKIPGCVRKKTVITAGDVYSKSQYDPDLMSKKIAEQFRECWYKTGEGKVNPFTRKLSANNLYCMVCSEVQLDPVLLKRMQGDGIAAPALDGFSDYFKTTAMGPGKYGNPQWTYADYLTKTKLVTSPNGPMEWRLNSPTEPAFAASNKPLSLREPIIIMYGYKREGNVQAVFTDDYNTVFFATPATMGAGTCDTLLN